MNGLEEFENRVRYTGTKINAIGRSEFGVGLDGRAYSRDPIASATSMAIS